MQGWRSWFRAAALAALASVAFSGCGGDEGGTADNFGGGSGSSCTTRSECAADEWCQSGACAKCQCPAGQLCSETGQCVSSPGTCEPACSSGEICSAKNVCIAQGSCKDDLDCATSPGLKCNLAEEKCVPGGDCGEKPFTITAQAPNLLIVLDRSGSMDGEVPNTGGKSRWQVAGEAVAQLLSSYSAKIDFGLNLFSACTGNGCAPGTIVAPIGSSDAAINSAIAGAQLCNSGDPETVVGGTLQALVGEQSLQDPGRDNVVLLITDGHDNCGGGGPAAAAALASQAVPVTTYIVGFSGDVNAAELDAIAQAAGTAPYKQADDANQLNAALQGIAAGVATCTFELDSVPPSGGLYTFFDKNPTPIPQDPNNGWTYDPATNSITFHGTACAEIKAGTVKDIDVIYSCSQPVPS